MKKSRTNKTPAQAGVKVRDTSMRAFLRIKNSKGEASDKQHIFNAILATGDEGLTSKEAEIRTKIPHERSSARAHDLLRDGFLVRTGKERLNPSGHPAEILIVPQSVRDGEQAVPLAVQRDFTKFTVQTEASTAWLMLDGFCVAKFTDSENGNAAVSANAVAFHLNKLFRLK